MIKEQFYKEYYGNSVIRDLVKEQFKDAAFAVGSGPLLKEFYRRCFLYILGS